jgi:hypothetical protein
MKSVHHFFGKVMIVTGALFLGFIFTDLIGISFPLWLKNYTFAIFGVALSIYAFSFKRWREDEPE